MVGRKNQKLKLDLEEAEDDDRPTVVLSSSDDEEANEDLSLKIVEKALLQRAAKVAPSPPSGFIAVDDDTDVSSGSVVSVPSLQEVEEKEKKGKKIKIKRLEVQDETVIAASEEEKAELIEATKEIVESVDPDSVERADNIVLRKLLRGPRYFDPPNSSWGTCYNCGEEGHAAVNCTSQKRKKPCFVCGSFDHNAKQCTKARDCYICKMGGHRAKDCPEKQKLGSQASKVCLKCGQSGHDMFSCRNDYSSADLKNIQCYICRSFGHLCCVDSVDTTSSQVSCYRCGRLGHTGLACSSARRGEKGEATPSSCYDCGEEGHLAKECKSITKGEATPSSCFKCGEEGHFARECKRSTKIRNGTLEEATPSSCYNCGGGGHFARDCKSSAKLRNGTQEEAAPGSCYKCGEGGHYARECKNSPKRRKRNHYDDGEDHMGVKSSPNNSQNSSKRKKNQDKDKGVSTPQKSKHRGGWIMEDPGESSFRKSNKNSWRSPVTPSYTDGQAHKSQYSNHKVTNTPDRRNYNSQYGGHTATNGTSVGLIYNSRYNGHNLTNTSGGQNYNSPYGRRETHPPRFSTSRFGNTGSDWSSRKYDW